MFSRRLSYIVLALTVFNLSGNANAAQGFSIPDFDLSDFQNANQNAYQDANNAPGYRVISGSATKGPIANATVSAFEVDDKGAALGSAVATTTTSSGGSFTLDVPAGITDLLLLKTSGGSFIDESDTRPLAQRRRITLGNNEGFRSILLPGESTVAITPYTDALVERSLLGGRLGGFGEIMEDVIALSTSGFRFNVFSTLPTDPSAPNSSATTSQLQYALLLGATANIANVAALRMGMAEPNYAVIRALINDMVDGSNDGLFFGEPIVVSGKVFPAVDFDRQMARFRNNNYAGYTDTVLPGWDSADDDLAIAFPSAFFATFEYGGEPLQFGIGAHPWGKVKLNPDGTGELAEVRGIQAFNWAGASDSIVIDFTEFGSLVSLPLVAFFFNPVTGLQEQLEITSITDRIELERAGDNAGKPLAIATEYFRRVEENLATGEVNEFEFTLTDTITIYPRNETLAFDPPDEFVFSPALPAFNSAAVSTGLAANASGLDVDLMTFNTDGTGTTRYENDSFTWEVAADGHLKVDFGGGETADYYILFQDDPQLGDYVAVDYAIGDIRFHYGSTVFSKDPNASWDNQNFVGVFEQRGTALLDDGTRADDTAVWRHHPDGTAIGEFNFLDFTSGNSVTFPSQFAGCWSIDTEGYFNRRRTFVNGQYGRGPLPTPAVCNTLTDDDISWIRSHDLYEEDGSEYKTVIRFMDDACYLQGDIFDSCGPNDIVFNIHPAAYNRIHTYTNMPPIGTRDFYSGIPGETFTMNVLANDFSEESPIDISTLEVTNGPFEFGQNGEITPSGTLTVDSSTGVITYTPGSQSGDFMFNYQVKDSNGNPSNTVLVQINVSP